MANVNLSQRRRVPGDLLEANVAKVGVRDVSDENPSDFEDPLPFVGRPHGATPCVVHLSGKNRWKGIVCCSGS